MFGGQLTIVSAGTIGQFTEDSCNDVCTVKWSVSGESLALSLSRFSSVRIDWGKSSFLWRGLQWRCETWGCWQMFWLSATGQDSSGWGYTLSTQHNWIFRGMTQLHLTYCTQPWRSLMTVTEEDFYIITLDLFSLNVLRQLD